jgi:hypothetical protein
MLSEVDRKRAKYQEMAAEELIGFGELRERLSQLDETRKVGERELQTLSERKERIADLERDRDALLESYAGMVPEGMDLWTAEERHRVYQMLRLTVYAAPGEKTEVEMLIDYTADVEEALHSVNIEGSSTQTPNFRRTSGLRFSVLLENWAQPPARTCASVLIPEREIVRATL